MWRIEIVKPAIISGIKYSSLYFGSHDSIGKIEVKNEIRQVRSHEHCDLINFDAYKKERVKLV